MVAVLPENGRGEILEGAVLVDKPGCTDGTDARNPRITIRGVADEREEVGDVFGVDTILRPHARGIQDLLRPAQHLDDMVASHALREVLVRGPDADLPHVLILCGGARGRGER